jgi:hypothetical protein
MVQDGATDVGTGEGCKGRLQVVSVELRSSDQTEETHLGEILLRFLAAQPVMTRERRNKMAMGFHQSIALLEVEREGSSVPVAGGGRAGRATGASVHGFSVFEESAPSVGIQAEGLASGSAPSSALSRPSGKRENT